MACAHRHRFLFVGVTVLAVAVLALAVAQSAHVHPMLPAMIVVLAIACVTQPQQIPSSANSNVLPFRRLPRGFVRDNFAMPPPIAFAV